MLPVKAAHLDSTGRASLHLPVASPLGTQIGPASEWATEAGSACLFRNSFVRCVAMDIMPSGVTHSVPPLYRSGSLFSLAICRRLLLMELALLNLGYRPSFVLGQPQYMQEGKSRTLGALPGARRDT